MNEAIPDTDKWTICDLKMWELDEWPEVIRCQHHEDDSDFRFYYPERTGRILDGKCTSCNARIANRMLFTFHGTEGGAESIWHVTSYCPNCGARLVSE